MRQAAGAVGRVVQRLLAALVLRDEFGQRVGRDGRMGHHHLRQAQHLRDRREILLRVIRQLVEQKRIAGDRRFAGQQQRVAVGGRLGDGHRADDGGRAGLVVDDDRLLPLALQLLGQHAGDDVDAATRCVGHDDAHGLVREGLLRKGAGQRGSQGASSPGGKPLAAGGCGISRCMPGQWRVAVRRCVMWSVHGAISMHH